MKFAYNNFVHNLKYGLKIKAKAAKIFTFLQAEVVSRRNNCTRCPQSDKFSWIRKVQSSTTHWSSVIMNLNGSFSGIIYCYVTTTPLPRLPLYCKLQNAQLSNQYSVHKINTYSVYTLDVDLPLQKWNYTVQNVICLMLTHISSRIRGIRVRASCLMTVSLPENK
jgi:hypothetical protein